jgi:hypothetical protein
MEIIKKFNRPLIQEVEESNCDVISGLSNPLVPETTSGQNQKNHKTCETSQTAADRRVKHKDRKDYLWSAYQIVILFLVSGATYCQFLLPVCFVKMKKRE